MPIIQTGSKDRYEFLDSINLTDIHDVVSNSDIKTLQTSTVSNPKTFELLNEYFFSKRPDVTLRLYGFYQNVCDLSIAESLTNVQHFSVDCVRQSKNLDSIKGMANLSSLSIGIYDAESFDILDYINQNLQSLSLMSTASKKPDISNLARFAHLKTLYLEGQQKGIECVSELKELRDITLRSISTKNLNYLSELQNLYSVDIKLGGIKNFDALTGLKSLKYLELWQIRNFHSADFIGDLMHLQNLFMQCLPNIYTFPDLTNLQDLRRIRLETMKGLKDFNGICRAPNLEEIWIMDANKQEVSDLFPLLEMTQLKCISAFFGSTKKNSEFLELADSKGIKPFQFRDFVYK